MELNKAEIIKRGYATLEEYAQMQTGIEKLNFDCGDGIEGIWIYPLEESSVNGQKFHFVFCNNPISLMGSPRPITGLVGIGASQGKSTRATAQIGECIEMFEKTGKPAIDYFHSIAKKK